jgi:hypothetical protein
MIHWKLSINTSGPTQVYLDELPYHTLMNKTNHVAIKHVDYTSTRLSRHGFAHMH